MLAQYFHDPEVDQVAYIGFHSFSNSSCEITEDDFSVEPGNPHIVFVFDGWEGVDGFLELWSNFFGGGCVKEGWDVEEVTFRSGIGKD